jgi:hypothetical protein
VDGSVLLSVVRTTEPSTATSQSSVTSTARTTATESTGTTGTDVAVEGSVVLSVAPVV